MNFSEYQQRAKATAIYPKKLKVLYPVIGLAGETGEVSEKVKKVFRDNDGIFSEEKRNEIAKELGDVLWYLSAIASDLDLSLEEIAEGNTQKLSKRKENGTLQGSGDNR